MFLFFRFTGRWAYTWGLISEGGGGCNRQFAVLATHPPLPWERYSLIQAIKVCAAPKGLVFAPFWSENRYRFCPFWSGIGCGLQRNYGCILMCSPFQFQMNKKESVTGKFEMDFRKSFCEG